MKMCLRIILLPRLFIKGRTMGTISLGGTKIFSYQIENILNQFLPRTTLNYKVIVKRREI